VARPEPLHSARLRLNPAALDDTHTCESVMHHAPRRVQFLSKMSKGELILDGNGVKEAAPSSAPAAGAAFAAAATATGSAWADELAATTPLPAEGAAAPSAWAAEFQQQHRPLGQDWVDQFAAGVASGVADLSLDGEGRAWVQLSPG